MASRPSFSILIAFFLATVATFNCQGQTPASITAVVPAILDAGGAPFTLTVSGSGFSQGAVVYWSGIPLNTSSDQAGDLFAVVPAGSASVSGAYGITVQNPDGTASNSFTVSVRPVLTAFDPAGAAVGDPPFLVTATGAGFVPTDVIVFSVSGRQWQLPTTYSGSGTLTAFVPADVIASPFAAMAYVLDPSQGTISTPLPFMISGNMPYLSAVDPTSVTAGGPSFSLTVSGRNFLPGAVATWNGVSLSTTVLNEGQLTATVPAALISTSSDAVVSVANPGGPPAAGIRMVGSSPPPAVSGCVPPSLAGTSGFQLTVYGAGFQPDASLLWNGSPLSAAASSGQLSATVPPGLLTAASGTAAAYSGGVISNCVAVSLVPPPVLMTVSPNQPSAGGGALTVTLQGSGFVPGSTINWAGTPVPTTFQGFGGLTATVPASMVAISGRYALTVVNPDGTNSNASAVSVQPLLASISPASAAPGSLPLTITATGSGFTVTDILVINRSASQVNLATTYISPTTLTASIPAASLMSAANATIQVLDSAAAGALFSQPAAFAVGSPPSIASLLPSSVKAAGPDFTLTVTGSGFSSGAVVQWNRTALATTFVSNTQLTAIVPAASTLNSATAQVMVVNPDSGASNLLPFTVNPSQPAITAVSPASMTAGGPASRISVYGTGFQPASAVAWNGVTLETTFAGPTQLTASVPAVLIRTAGTAALTAVNGDGTSSDAFSYSINAPLPKLTGVSPVSAPAGSAPLTETVFGTGFLPGTTVQWNGAPLLTTVIDPTHLAASIPAALLASPGIATIAVANPDGTVSSAVRFTIGAPGPVISGLNPGSVVAGGAGFSLTISGSGFDSSTTVQWNGSPLATTLAGPTRLIAAVPPSAYASAGIAALTVVGQGGVSNAVTIAIYPPAPSIVTNGVLNGASGLPSIAPGSIISIYGSQLALGTFTFTQAPAPATLGGTTVTINNVAAPLLLVSPSQINAQVPFETPAGTVSLAVQTLAPQGASVTFNVTPSAPGVFTQPDRTHALALNYSDGTVNSPDNPALPGQYVVAYVTGQGALDNVLQNGQAAPAAPLSKPLAAVQATIGGQPAAIYFAGLAPGLIGVLQMNILIPDVAPGDQPFEVTIGGVAAAITVLSIGSQ
jgi:uncharacterized protein (TIGR03437 family)